MAGPWTGPTGWTGPRGPSFPPTGITGLTGQDGVNGPMGPTGPVGPVGILGWGGGTTLGPTGSPRFNISNITGTSLTLVPTTLGTTYYITNTGFNSITAADLSSVPVGSFWTLQNLSGARVSINLVNCNVNTSGSTALTSVAIQSGTGITLVALTPSSSGSVFIVL